MAPRLRYLALLLLAATACDLTEVELVDFAEVFVAEVYVTVGETPSENRMRAFIHGTAPGSAPSTQTYDDAQVTVTDGDDATVVLGLTAIDACARTRPEDGTGSCFAADAIAAGGYEAGERLFVEVALTDGRRLVGETRIPGSFAIDNIVEECVLQPNTRFLLTWTRADSAWAYLSEALLLNLPEALASEGIEAPDTVDLLGLSISESDTTVSFPNELGIFDRFDLEQDLAVRLQRGLPDNAIAEVSVTAVDRNFTNWVRGGNFNPSGAVRVGSLVGDGAGVFASAVTKNFTIYSTFDGSMAPQCAGP